MSLKHEQAVDARITAGILTAIERDGATSQRGLASELGIALGLVNAYVKRCSKKGLIKVRTAPASRYAYYITPKGLAEKSRLTAAYLSHSLSFFRSARQSCSGLLAHLASERKWRAIAVAGSGDLAEIAILCALEQRITVVAVVDNDEKKSQLIGVPIVGNLKAVLPHIDGVIVACLVESQQVYESAVRLLGAERVAVPDVLGVSRDAGARSPVRKGSA
jgi:DNA-binding MarR family transcriptional regulator